MRVCVIINNSIAQLSSTFRVVIHTWTFCISQMLSTLFKSYLYTLLFVSLLEAKKTTWLPALLGRSVSRKLTSNTILVIAKVLFLTPWFCLIIWMDDNLVHMPLIFPRTRSDIMKRKSHFFTWLIQSSKWRQSKKFKTKSPSTIFLSAVKTTQLISIQDHNVLEHEPDKNADTCLLNVTCRTSPKDSDNLNNIDNPDNERTIQLFVKFSCGRNFPMALQGIRCATEWGLQRELDFYTSIGRLQHILPCPTSVALNGSFSANRLCMVTDFVKGVVTPDYIGANAYQAKSVVATVANMHGTFWCMNLEQSATSQQVMGNANAAVYQQTDQNVDNSQQQWISNEIVSFLDKINARNGLEYFSFIRPLLDKKEEPTEFLQIWNCLEQWFLTSNTTTTVVHGDCRLGNMMFVDDSKNSQGDSPNAIQTGKILFTDFEAVNVAPYLWDFVYFTVLCQTPKDRRDRHTSLMNNYLTSLRTTTALTKMNRTRHGGLPISNEMMPPKTVTKEINELYDILSLVLFFYSYTVERSGMWAGNGNSMEDLKFWTERLDERIQEIDMKKMSQLLKCDEIWLSSVKNLVWEENEGSMSKKQQ